MSKFRNENQVCFAADARPGKYTLGYTKGKDSKPYLVRDDENGTHGVAKLVISALNTHMDATAEGPQHGTKPQTRIVFVGFELESKTPVPAILNQISKTIENEDGSLRAEARYSACKGGGGQLAVVDIDKITNLEDALAAI